MSDLLHGDITRDIIGAAFEVQKALGYGFLEKVYENAMVVELLARNRQAEQQVAIDGNGLAIMWRIWWWKVRCWWR